MPLLLVSQQELSGTLLESVALLEPQGLVVSPAEQRGHPAGANRSRNDRPVGEQCGFVPWSTYHHSYPNTYFGCHAAVFLPQDVNRRMAKQFPPVDHLLPLRQFLDRALPRDRLEHTLLDKDGGCN